MTSDNITVTMSNTLLYTSYFNAEGTLHSVHTFMHAHDTVICWLRCFLAGHFAGVPEIGKMVYAGALARKMRQGAFTFGQLALGLPTYDRSLPPQAYFPLLQGRCASRQACAVLAADRERGV